MANVKSAWGIDIGNRALKAVRVVREGEGVRITDFEVIEHENILSNAGDNREALIQTALTAFVQSHNIKKEDVAVGVSGQSSFARFIKLPPVEPRQIPSIVRFEAIQQIPFPLDEVEWSYQLFKDEASPDVEVGIFAMRKELVQEHIKFFTDAGLNVQVVQMNPLAVYNGMYFDERLKGTTMVIDLGAENTDLIIAEGETIWLRSIPIGGNSFTESLVKSFKLRFEKAEDLKRNAATSKYGRQILQAMRPIFADLVAEIQRSIGFYASVHRDSRITKVVALGGTFRLPGLQKYLQQNLQLEVTKIDRLGSAAPADAKVAAGLGENILSSVGAYGLALQAIGEGKITSSLLPQAIQREREWRAKSKWFAAAAACFVAGTGLAVGRYFFEQAQFAREEPTRTATDDILKTATRMDQEWKGVEGGGAAEISKISVLKGLGDYRDLWQSVYNDIVTSVPPSPETQAEVKLMGPRDKRQQIIIDDINPRYNPNLTDILLLDNQGILPYVGLSAPAVYIPTGGPAAPARNPWGGRRQPGMAPGMQFPAAPIGPVAPSAPLVAPGGTPTAEGTPRGYLITIHCRTPYFDGLKLVTDKLVSSLNQKQTDTNSVLSKGATPKPQYIFQKVWVPRYVQLKNDKGRVQELKARAKALQPVTPTPPPIGIAVQAPPISSGAPADDPDPVDPLTNESIMADWDVIVMTAVVLDPPKPPAPTPPPEQAQNPRGAR